MRFYSSKYFILQIMGVLKMLPITNKTVLKDSKVLGVMRSGQHNQLKHRQ